VIREDVVDITLMSLSNLEQLVKREAFRNSDVKPAIRANDTTDVWRLRGATYHTKPSRPYRTASLKAAREFTDLGLYSITINNDLERDIETLRAFAEFREDAAAYGFSYFLEVFNPNASNLSDEDTPRFVNDAIVRTLAGLTEAERPKFLKIVYNGPRALDELTSFDPRSSSACWAAAPARRETASSCSTRRRSTARGWRCSGEKSCSLSRRSTLCALCARWRMARSSPQRPSQPTTRRSPKRRSRPIASYPPTRRSPKRR